MTMSTPQSPATAMDAFWENVRTIVLALMLAMTIRFTIAQPFRIPSSSMEPTLVVGDYIVVSKWSFGYGRYSFAPLEGVLPHGRLFGHQPARGEVIVFRPEAEPDRDVIKRLIGMPGDRIQVRHGVLYLNGEAVQREDLGETPFEEADGRTNLLQAYRETLPGGASYVVFDRYPNQELDDTRVYVVPDDHYFLMGDNRDNSDDSRKSMGYVPFDNLVGPAQFVVLSFDSTTSLFKPWTLLTGLRGERFFKPVE